MRCDNILRAILNVIVIGFLLVMLDSCSARDEPDISVHKALAEKVIGKLTFNNPTEVQAGIKERIVVRISLDSSLNIEEQFIYDKQRGRIGITSKIFSEPIANPKF